MTVDDISPLSTLTLRERPGPLLPIDFLLETGLPQYYEVPISRCAELEWHHILCAVVLDEELRQEFRKEWMS